MIALEKLFQKNDEVYIKLIKATKFFFILLCFYISAILKDNTVYDLVNYKIYSQSSYMYSSYFVTGVYFIFNLFDKKFCNYFSKCFFIIEDHNFNVRNNKILSNFYKIINKNFHVEIIKDHSKKPFGITILDKFSDDEKYLMMSEGRPETMQWLVLTPK